MAPESARSLRDELPAHEAWVRKLARSLVRDEASADDLVQDAQLAALRRSSAAGIALGPWLARVTRNFARRGWRDAARRASRERAAAHPEALPGADESAARVEIQRRLVEELSALEPALRHALVRRYFDGWTAARIARETGEPAPTVRWRLQRGLAELRARLDRSAGGDGLQWRLALLPLCGTPAPWTALGPGVIQGALTMKAASQVLAAGALLAAVGVGVWWSAARDEGSHATVAGDPAERTAELVAPAPLVRELVPPPQPAREALAVAPQPAPSAPTAVEESTTLRIEGRCVDDRLVPIGGARVSQVSEAIPPRTETPADGQFVLVVTPTRFGACSLALEAAGFATRVLELTLPASGTMPLGDVVLAPGGSVRGRVLGVNGASFPGATVTITAPDLWGSLEAARVGGPFGTQGLTGVSGADGRFEIAGAGVGPVRAWAGASGMHWAISAPVEVRAHEASEEIELVLEPLLADDRISGVVLSPEGEPVPHAMLDGFEREGGGMTSLSVAVDEHGRFELLAKADHTYDLAANDPETERRWSEVAHEGIAPGTHDLEFRFQSARWLELHVETHDGEPLEDYLVATLGEGEHRDSFPLFRRVRGAEHPGGDERLLVPAFRFYVSVDARGFAPGELGPFEPESAPASLTLQLDEEPGLRGRVLAGGQPFAGARVQLYKADPHARIDHQGYPSLCEPRPDDETVSDAEGRFVLRLRSVSSWIVRAEADGYAAGDVGPLALDPRLGHDDLELVLGRGGALEGRVRVAAGRDPSGVIVVVNRGDAHPRSMRSDAEGAFHFEGLSAGPWHLSRGSSDINPQGGGTAFGAAKKPTVIPFNCTVRDGETTYQDLDLSDWEPCALAGVLLVNGAPAANWGVMVWPGEAEAAVGTPPSTTTGADGRFALTIDEGGPARLSFSPPAELGGGGRIDAHLELHPGANEWHDDLVMGRLRGRCLTPLAKDSALFFRSAADAKNSCWLQLQPDADGSYALPFVPAGKGSIQLLSESGRSTLVETEIPARGERVLDIP